jgi:DNA-binding CsgD family transcriptional regulator
VESIRHSSYLVTKVTTLAARDAERLLRFVAEAENLGGDDPFTPNVLAELGQLVHADWVSYCEQDRVRQRCLLAVYRPDDEQSLCEDVTYWDIAAEHLVSRHHDSGDFRALKLSDFVSLRELRKTHIYEVWFGPDGVDHELNVAIPSPPSHTKTFLFDRQRRDFTERDRVVLDVLQPHLSRLWRAARTRRRLNAALEALEWASELDGRGVVVLGRNGRVEYASAPAERLLAAYFGRRKGAELPAVLADWVVSDCATLARRVGDRVLTIDRSGDALLLQERFDTLGLTPREHQVLAWVARGQTNLEVAETLWISPGTVRKHLENIYAKLGVSSRTAAAARFLATLDVETDTENADQ